MVKKVAILFSGGKDSCLALEKVINDKEYEVKFLLNVNVKNKDSFMFHKPEKELLEEQSRQLGLPLITIESEGEEEKELKDLEKLFEKVKKEVDGIVVGGIASSYQGKRIKKICKKFDLEFIAPIWDYEPEEVWEELIKKGFKVILTKISCDGLEKEWLGKIITKKELEKLNQKAKKYKFRLDFEGGEAESLVLWMPGMKNEIKVEGDVKSEGNYRHFFEINKIELIKKNEK